MLETTFSHIHTILDPMSLLQTVGLLGLLAVIFAESGLFFGFFLPGDSLLFTAGFLASQGYLPFFWTAFGCFVAAVLGDTVGYWFGKYVGIKMFTREDSFFFHKKHVARAQHFYEKHGAKTIILARFIPAVRTFAPIVAGVGTMKYRTFLTYNIMGAVIWALGLTSLGYWLGNTVPNIDTYLIPIILIIIAVSFVPIIVEIIKSRIRARRAKQGIL